MKSRRLFLGLLIVGSMVFPAVTHAANPSQRDKKEVVWTKKANKRTGLYTKQNSAIANGLTLSFNALYYYGDVDLNGIAMNGGFQTQNVTFGGAAAFAYTMPAGKHTNWRFAISAGALKGDNSHAYPDHYRKFNSVFGEASVGVEWYPFSQAGFYLYGGIALTYSHIKYDFMSAKGNANSILPMIPLEIGYDFKLGRSWGLKINVAAHQGLLDTPHCNLDAYPMESSQNQNGVSFGRGGGNKWADGFFQIGLSLTYRWHNCEACRLYKW
ncbi:MAG: hypothetical protein NC038_01865 [Paludibacter sp.]|nr:hypothetical protein [Bacteroidales bacterium]MCM1068420.1 hypothetical protein [Prevotella sp.]MCM1353375.1 hypothetical protein [Bacteroides sp.]MCM1442536.1 hypothetical protein [Muribaculum sp.]MCM1481381.1 hypothetical protein [Paludibacter sp.]